jgi:hypothetical protein
MLPLSAELEFAANEIRTWAHLHKTEDDSDIGVWRALVTIDKAVNQLRRQEK